MTLNNALAHAKIKARFYKAPVYVMKSKHNDVHIVVLEHDRRAFDQLCDIVKTVNANGEVS